MEKKDMLTLSLSSIAIIITVINLYKTFWQKPSPVISLKSKIIGDMVVEGGQLVNFLFLEGLMLNSSKIPLVLQSVQLKIIHEGGWVRLPWIHIDKNETITLAGKPFKFGPNADKFDLMKMSPIITMENPQFFYAKFNIPQEFFNKIIDESANLLFIVRDGFGREYNYMVSTEIVGALDMTKLPNLYLKNPN